MAGEVEEEVAERLVGGLPAVGLADEGAVGEVGGLLVFAGEDEAADLGQVAVGVGVDGIVGAAGPEGVLV